MGSRVKALSWEPSLRHITYLHNIRSFFFFVPRRNKVARNSGVLYREWRIPANQLGFPIVVWPDGHQSGGGEVGWYLVIIQNTLSGTVYALNTYVKQGKLAYVDSDSGMCSTCERILPLKSVALRARILYMVCGQWHTRVEKRPTPRERDVMWQEPVAGLTQVP